MAAKDKDQDLARMLAAGKPRPWRKVLLWLLVLATVAGGWWWWAQKQSHGDAAASFETEKVSRGDLELTVSATGNLEPINQVTLGTEVSGTVEAVLVDTNDRVTTGQEMARLVPTKLQQEVDQAKAALEVARARVLQAQATLVETSANLARLQELHRLSNGRTPAQVQVDEAIAAGTRAQADLTQAEAEVRQAEATLQSRETDLGLSVIVAPVDGIVLSRKVEVGQTVAAQFSAPELFVLAESLEKMKLEVEVSEADISQVADGMQASFRVDAWPGREFSAHVEKVAFGSTNAQSSSSSSSSSGSQSSGVVTYTAELSVPNEDLSLRPGMTATAEIQVKAAHDVLLVPNAALRFTPPSDAPDKAQDNRSFLQRLMPGQNRRFRWRAGGEGGEVLPAGMGRIWLLRDGKELRVDVELGVSDGRMTEVRAAELKEGDEVILRQNSGGEEGRGRGRSGGGGRRG